LQWQLGDGIEEIAAEEGVTYNAVKHSIQYVEGRMSRADAVAGRGVRLKLRAVTSLADKYIAELNNLMSDDNPFVRSKALEHFRRTIGLESVGMQVKTEVNVQTNVAMGLSYEERLDRIRAQQERCGAESRSPLD
jgi:hypothetical protein